MQIAAPPSLNMVVETTMPTQPLALGTLCLRTVQNIAAGASSDPAATSDRSLLSGALIARRAAEQLILATPRTPQHRLDLAAAQAMDGAELLYMAAGVRTDEFRTDDALATIRDLTRLAREAFERALQRVEND